MERKGGAVFYVEKAERPVKAVSLGKRMACIRRDASSIGDPGFGDVDPSWASTLGSEELTALVHDNGMQPGSWIVAPAQARESGPRDDQRILGHVPGIVWADDRGGQSVHLFNPRLDERLEFTGRGIPCGTSSGQGWLHSLP